MPGAGNQGNAGIKGGEIPEGSKTRLPPTGLKAGSGPGEPRSEPGQPTPSFSMIRARCASAVFTLTPNNAATSLVLFPSATNWRTRHSRGVRGSACSSALARYASNNARNSPALTYAALLASRFAWTGSPAPALRHRRGLPIPCTHEDHMHWGPLGLDPPHRSPAPPAERREVHQHHIGPQVAGKPDRVADVSRFGHDAGLEPIVEEPPRNAPRTSVVLHDENPIHHVEDTVRLERPAEQSGESSIRGGGNS